MTVSKIHPAAAIGGRCDDRFWSKVDKGDSCWTWVGTRDRYGYGKFSLGRQTVTAHRHAYVALVGPIADGLTLDHLCRNRACVNPGHLEPVTNAENQRRAAEARPRAKQCLSGHDFTPENTRWRQRSNRSRPQRECLACERARERARPARRRLTLVQNGPSGAGGLTGASGGPQTPTTAFNAPGSSSVLRHARPERFPHRFSRVERGDTNRPPGQVLPHTLAGRDANLPGY